MHTSNSDFPRFTIAAVVLVPRTFIKNTFTWRKFAHLSYASQKKQRTRSNSITAAGMDFEFHGRGTQSVHGHGSRTLLGSLPLAPVAQDPKDHHPLNILFHLHFV